MNAKNISDVLEVLNLIDKASMDQFKDPRFIGRLQAAAFTKALPLRYALEKLNVEIRNESVSA